jgi:WhiB family redox-sensing transcriptional regulator
MTAFATRPSHATRALRAPVQVPLDYDRWQDAAACQGMDASTFYAHDGQRAASLRQHDDAAKQICASCPVVRQCLQYALDTREAWGVWGGKTADERQAMGWQITAATAFSVAG